MPTIVDSYSEANVDIYRSLGTNYTGMGQSFTAAGGVLDSCKFFLMSAGTITPPTGIANASIYSHSGTYGVSSIPGSLLAKSDDFNVGVLTVSPQLITFTFSGGQRIVFGMNTYYVVVLSFTGSVSSLIDVGVNADSPSHPGNHSAYTTSWAADPTRDTIFYVYRDSVIRDVISHGVIPYPR